MSNYNVAFNVEQNDFSKAGNASQKVKKILLRIGLDTSSIRRIAIACYEAEMNLAIHSFGGKIELIVDSGEVTINIDDIGPGINDVDLAMKEGYSTASNEVREMGFGAGMGLPNMKKCSDIFYIESEVGKGTKIIMKFRY